MTRGARRLALALGVAATSSVVPAAADAPPSLWEVARDPAARARFELHAKVREALSLLGEEQAEERKSLLLDRMISWLTTAGAENSPDVRLRYDLGELYEQRHRHEDAARILRPAVDANPEHPATIDALATLAYAYAYLDRPKDESEMYRRYLPRVREDRSKLVALLNAAEAQMHLGNLPEAVSQYRDAVALGDALAVDTASLGVMTTTVLSRWGLLVALDRAGEPEQAQNELRLVARADPDERIIGDTTTVFFVPRYERCWYLAMSATQHARMAATHAQALPLWRRAEAEWNEYVTEAAPEDRYASLARAHLTTTRAIVHRIEQAASHERPRQP